MAWSRVPFSAVASTRVPGMPGVYAILTVDRVHGLPTRTAVLYVGKSKNLRRRFGEHVTPWREANARIRRSGAHRVAGWEFWFVEVPEPELGDLERRLIRTVGPSANSIQYRGAS